MKQLGFIFIMLTIILPSCKMAELVLPNDLQEASSTYEIVGVNRIRLKKSISFGDYAARETKISMPSTTETNLFVKKKRGKQRIRFEVVNTVSKTTYEGFADNMLNQVQTKTPEGLRILFPKLGNIELNLDTEDYFIGSLTEKTTGKIWNFVVTDANGAATFRLGHGYITDGDNVIEINEAIDATRGHIPTREDGGTVNLGYTFRTQDKNIGAVKTFRNHKFIVDNDLSAEVKDVLAAVSSAFLFMDVFE